MRGFARESLLLVDQDHVLHMRIFERTIAGAYCPDIARPSGDTKKPPVSRGFVCARYWDRTSDLFRVREARYRCANRAQMGYSVVVEVATGFEPV